ncbi:MAG: glutathione S-transferase family protein [Planctomycetes bacterium]|nr:glutathione S-transferase family protein [Planctomycetota bacterium]
MTMELYGFETSNNMKVRVALGYKGLDYDWHEIDPQADRARIAQISGQHLTPVLIHGSTVLFDSAAILRYLDANFRGTPRLFGANQVEQWAIEDEEFFARTVLAGPMMSVVHRRVAGQPVDAALEADAGRRFAAAVETLAARLDGREWLVGDAMSAADITAACVIHRIRLAKLFPIPPVARGFAPWLERVLRHDRLRRDA